MNIEVKKTIEIEMVLQGLRNEIKHGCKETNKEMLEDAIKVIEVLSKKNKQLRDINKNLNEKLERRNATISDLTSQVGELNTLMFEMQIPEGITVDLTSNTELTIKGIDKEKVGEFAANVRKVRQPEPYKGKGIRYKDEHIIRKEGKKAA